MKKPSNGKQFKMKTVFTEKVEEMETLSKSNSFCQTVKEKKEELIDCQCWLRELLKKRSAALFKPSLNTISECYDQ